MKKGTVSILSIATGAILASGATGRIMSDKIQKIQEMSNRHLALFLLMNQWVKVKQKGKTISLFFEKNLYKKIAIYGMSYVGETLVDELRDAEIDVLYGIDKNVDAIYSDIDVFSPEDDLAEVDIVVVTAITFFNEIEKTLSKKLDCPIISLEEILYQLDNM